MVIPTGTAAISFSQLRTEMRTGSGDPTAYTPGFPLNDATFRTRLTDTATNASLSLSSMRGNIYTRFTVGTNYTGTYDIRAALTGLGTWNGTSKASVDVVVTPSSVYVSNPSTASYAMDTGAPSPTSWPAPSTIYLYNYGNIIGTGGNGGDGGDDPPGPVAPNNGTPGTPGGPALNVRRSLVLINNGSIGGGGGGGGGGGRARNLPTRYGGGGGGGGRTGIQPTSGGIGGTAPVTGNPGGPGSSASAGTGGASSVPAPIFGYPNAGGNGGGWGAAGAAGTVILGPGVPNPGGSPGVAIQGWPLVSAPTGPAGIYGPVA